MPIKKTSRTKSNIKSKVKPKTLVKAKSIKAKPKPKVSKAGKKVVPEKKTVKKEVKSSKVVISKKKVTPVKTVKQALTKTKLKVTKKVAKSTIAVKKVVPSKTIAKLKQVLKPVGALLAAPSKKATPKKKVKAAEKTQPTFAQVTSAHLSTMGVPPYQEKAGEAYMNAHQLSHFRQILNLWKQELMEEVDRTVHHMQDEAANFPDPNDRASQEEEFSLELRARDRERKLIKKIYEALHRMDQDEYGYCDACGIEIGIRRLEARPTATLCIDCKTLAEIKERQMGGVSVE